MTSWLSLCDNTGNVGILRRLIKDLFIFMSSPQPEAQERHKNNAQGYKLKKFKM